MTEADMVEKGREIVDDIALMYEWLYCYQVGEARWWNWSYWFPPDNQYPEPAFAWKEYRDVE